METRKPTARVFVMALVKDGIASTRENTASDGPDSVMKESTSRIANG